jgi:hypothetical protein
MQQAEYDIAFGAEAEQMNFEVASYEKLRNKTVN